MTTATTSLRRLIPSALYDEWRVKSRAVRRASWAAPFAALVAIARAEVVPRSEIPDNVCARYLDLLGVVPEVRRLRLNQRWLETHDDPFLPAGLYEAQMLSIYRWFGAFIASWWWLAVRNRAYQAASRFQFKHVEDFTEYAVFGQGDDKPYRPGEWLCIAMVAGEPRAFEYSRTWDYSGSRFGRAIAWLRTRFGQVREGWKLRPLAEGDRPEGPTATGILQLRSWRPFQSME